MRSRQRPRTGPIVPIGMPSAALMSAYRHRGSRMSMDSSSRRRGGSSANAARRGCIALRAEYLVVNHDGIGIHEQLAPGREPGVRMPVR